MQFWSSAVERYPGCCSICVVLHRPSPMAVVCSSCQPTIMTSPCFALGIKASGLNARCRYFTWSASLYIWHIRVLLLLASAACMAWY